MNSSLYDQSYFQAIRGGGKGDSLYTGFLSLLEDDPREFDILDLGCGRGEMVERLAQLGVKRLHGLDFSPAAVKIARARVPAEIAPQIRHGSATDYGNYPEASFDVIFMLDVVEHLPPPALAAALENACRWLRPNGRLIIHTFPTLGPHRLYQAWLRLRGRHDELAMLDQIHCNVQTRASLREVLKCAGFSDLNLFLKNNFTLTSSSFQRLPEGVLKSLLAFLLERVLGHSKVVEAFSKLGLIEFACPSLYCVAKPDPDIVRPALTEHSSTEATVSDKP